MVGGVVGILLPKVSTGICMGFMLSVYGVCVASVIGLYDPSHSSVAALGVFTIVNALCIWMTQKIESLVTVLKLSLASGLALAYFFDALLDRDAAAALAGAVMNKGVVEGEGHENTRRLQLASILCVWLSGTIATFMLQSYLSGKWKHGMWLYSADEAAPREARHRYSSTQKTFSYPDSLVYNYFDPDSLPGLLQAHADVIFTTAQALQSEMGFQVDNSRNQAEHLLMVLCNECRFGEHILTEPPARLHRKFFNNYRKWCASMGVQPTFVKKHPGKAFAAQIEDILLYLLIWGEAANIRFMPEALCFLFHKTMEVHINDNNRRKTILYPGFFLDHVITPIYEVVASGLKGKGDHEDKKNYDDFNEFFWNDDCLKYTLRDTSLDGLESGGSSSTAYMNDSVPVSIGMRESKKTYVEKRSWLHPLLSFHRILEWHVVTFTLLAVWGFSNDMVWSWKYTAMVGSFVFIEIILMGIFWTFLEVWTKFPQTDISGPAVAGFLLRLCTSYLILVYQTLYFYWSFQTNGDPSSPSHAIAEDVLHDHADANFWWWQYIWLSMAACSTYALELLLLWCPSVKSALLTSESGILQAVLNICWPFSQLYVGKKVHVSQMDTFRYISFWIPLIVWKLFFGFRFIVHPICAPSILMYDDMMNYDEIGFGKTLILFIIQWVPHFMVYLIDMSIWYSVWASFVGGYHALLERQGAVRDNRTLRSHFMNAPTAFFKNLMPPVEGLGLASSVSREAVMGLPINQVVGEKHAQGKAKAKRESSNSSSGSSSRHKSTADLSSLRFNSHAPISTEGKKDQVSSGNTTSSDHTMMKFLDARSMRWVIFANVWNEIIGKLRQTDHVSNFESKNYLFSTFPWLSKPVYLPLFQTAGSVEAAVYAFLQTVASYDIAEDMQSRLRVVDDFQNSLDVTTWEAVSEAWELTRHVLKDLLGVAHREDMDAVFLAMERWATSGDIYSCIKSSSIKNLVKYVTNMVTIMKGAAHKRRAHPVVTPEKRREWALEEDKGRDSIPLLQRNGSGIRKSVSTGFLQALRSQDDVVNTDDVLLHNESATGTPTTTRQFTKLQPFRRHVALDDFVRDRIRDEIRNLLVTLRGALRTADMSLVGQDIADKITFVLSVETGFVCNDLYASMQIDEFFRQGASDAVIHKLSGLLMLRQTQVDLKSFEAKRRLNFFVNSLFMDIPEATTMRFSKEYTCLTPFYSEDVMLSKHDLQQKNSDGVSTILYLQTLYKTDWNNFLERNRLQDEADIFSDDYIMETRMWASLRAQTLFRTVEGMMQSEDAIKLLARLERLNHTEVDVYGKLKFNYVVACQVYGNMKRMLDPKAADIDFLLRRHPNLRVAYMDHVRLSREGEAAHYSVLIKANPVQPASGPTAIKEVFRVKLPGNAVIGEGKPENQNHAVIFTRGRYLQTIDMNQDGYFEEALKMRNVLEEFDSGYAIVGFREHIFTGSVSSVANYMALQELSFVTLGQRVLADPLKIRQHYGHPDMFDKLYVMTEGGVSKASKGINLSEDVFAGYNATIRGHSVGFKEYAQVGKGRDVGLQQTYKFEAKLAQGNAEQSLSRDLSRICDRLDFFRLFSFYYGGIGHYMANTLVMMALVIVSYCMVGLAVFDSEGINGRPLDPEGVLQLLLAGMGLLQTMPLFVTLSVEKGIYQAIAEIAYMMLSGGPLYFIFHIQTKSFYFAQTIMAGGAKYRPTGRGFVIRHSPFDEIYRFFALSHIYIGFELLLVLVLLGAYTTSKQYFGLTWAIWLTVISFMFGPFWFNPLAFETSKVSEDYHQWLTWMSETGGTSDQSWATWWREENSYVAKLSLSWKVMLAVIRTAMYGTLALGIFGSRFVKSRKEQLRVVTLLMVFAGYIIINWIISKMERRFSYAFRRLAHFFVSSIAAVIVVALFVTHLQYFKYCIALYYTGALLATILIMVGFEPVMVFFQMHDYLIGHVIFIFLYVASVFQVGVVQTWLLYHNALSSGVEIEAVLKYARQTQARGGTSGLQDTVVDELKEQVAEQAKTIRQLIAGLTKATTGTGVPLGDVSELRGLLDSFKEQEEEGKEEERLISAYGATEVHAIPLRAARSSMPDRLHKQNPVSKIGAAESSGNTFFFEQPTSMPPR